MRGAGAGGLGSKVAQKNTSAARTGEKTGTSSLTVTENPSASGGALAMALRYICVTVVLEALRSKELSVDCWVDRTRLAIFLPIGLL